MNRIIVFGLAVGLKFPDIDQQIGHGQTDLLLHRSILTHGLIIPVILFVFTLVKRSVYLERLTLGVMLGVAIHLSFDLFPKSWYGFALISIPFNGWTPVWFSWLWIATSIVACTYMASRMVRTRVDYVLFGLSFLLMFVCAVQTERTFWEPLVTLTIAIGITFGLPLYRWASSTGRSVVTVSLDDKTVSKIDELVNSGVVNSRSEAIDFLVGKGINTSSDNNDQ